MNICIIGCGNLGTAIAEHADSFKILSVWDIDQKKVDSFSKKFLCAINHPLDFPKCDLVVEVASANAVREFIPYFAEKGTNTLVMSIGALSDEKLKSGIESLAKKSGAKVILPSGAIAGIDGIRAASCGEINSLVLTSTKPPSSLGVKTKTKKIVFEGNAKEAVKKYPKNLNIAATVSLAGAGFDKTKVKLVADPGIKENCHEVRLDSEYLKLHTKCTNVPSKKNPKTSYIAAMSAISAIRKLADDSPFIIG